MLRFLARVPGPQFRPVGGACEWHCKLLKSENELSGSGALSIERAQGTPAATRELMVYANAIGCGPGPKLTAIGSLATLLWLHVLGTKDLRISWSQHMRVVLTLPLLLLAALALWLPLLGPA